MPTQTTLQIAGMDCSHCAQRLRVSLQRLDGVIKAEVDPAGTATVRYDEGRVSEDQLGQRVREAGFELA
ncbi:MAG TPA: heavy-metal-associated domain-containing protein [Nitriliruptorales bacterium]|nr:heavy-metal-associated domain-containing protein [Nitriliruptorales bacterium]